jgi:hypothetical protein
MRRNATSTIYNKTTSNLNRTASIYGAIKIKPVAYPVDCKCVSTVDPLVALQKFLEFLTTLYTALELFKIGENVNSPLVAFMSVAGAMKFSLHTRIVWTKLNPGVMFDIDSSIHINALKDIYLSYNRDWNTDPFLVTQSLLLATYD